MKNIQLIKWILSLSDRDRTLAVMLIAVLVLWSQSLWDKNQYNKLQDLYRVEIINRTDTCDAEKLRLVQNQILHTNRLQVLVDSLTRENLLIITKNNKNLKFKTK